MDSEKIHQIAETLGIKANPASVRPVTGGCIHEAFRVSFKDGTTVFVKQGSGPKAPMLRAEHLCLLRMSDTHSIRCPLPLAIIESKDSCMLILEHLNLQPLHADAAIRLGHQLATLHRQTAPTFGWDSHNFIGATPQNNTRESNWATFFLEHRLLPQLKMAEHLIPSSRWNGLEKGFFRLMDGHTPQPSFLHGDLWGGNAASIEGDQPVVFDPASYYGDRETDIAFTHVFGGFSPGFYHAYQEAWPLPDDHSRRQTTYNLYHILNHLNLFGSGYLQFCHQAIESLLLHA